jgi:glycosyltransferase involved in cell wall biosynthesis
MPKTELAQWLQHALASILTIKNIPMLHTCCPNKIFDAFAAGKPIIQTTTGWIKDFTADEQCGLNVTPENPAELAKAFEFYFANKDVAAQHGKNAKRLAETIFSRDHCANTMLNAILKLKPTDK